MSINKVFDNFKILFIAFSALTLANSFNFKSERPYLQISKQDSSINLDHQFVAKFNLGFKRLISATLWISTILESDVEHYKGADFNSWMFLRFNSISIIDPLFYENYVFGGTYLSIVKDDVAGASIIYQKGLKLFPDDFQLLKNAGFHYYFEARDKKEAFPIYQKLTKMAPSNMAFATVLSRLIAGEGNLDDAFEMLTDLQTKHDLDSVVGQKIYQFRYAIRAEIDLECLNANKKQCRMQDLDGNPYLKKDHQYFAIRKWIPYRPKSK